MRGLRIEVECDLSGLEQMFSDSAMNRAQKATTEYIKTSTDEADGEYTSRVTGETRSGYTPYMTGGLRGSSHVRGDQMIVYSINYASYVYNGTSKMAAYPWFEIAKANELENWEQYVLGLIMGGA